MTTENTISNESGKGPFTKVNGKATDVGLFDHVFNGEDDRHDALLKQEKLLKVLTAEMQKRGFLTESLDEQLKTFTKPLQDL